MFIMLALFAWAFYYFYNKQPDMSLVIRQRQAEKELLVYSNAKLIHQRNSAQVRMDSIAHYEKHQRENFKNV